MLRLFSRCSYAYFILFLSRCKRFVPAISDNTRPSGKRQQSRMQRKPGQNRSWHVPQTRFTVHETMTIVGALQSVPQHQGSWSGRDSEYTRKGTKERERKSQRRRRGTVGGLLLNRNPHSPLTLRAAIDCLSVHADDEQKLTLRRSNGAIENTFPEIVGYFHPDCIY